MNSRRVLVIDSNEDNRVVFTTVLEHFGYEVVCAPTGQEGLAEARRSAPDLVVLRRGLPDTGPWEVARALRRDPAFAGVRIVGLSARALAETRLEALDAGCDVFLATPLEPRRLLAEVQRLLA